MSPPEPSARSMNPNPEKAADAVYGRRFDPWNSVGLGHQRAEARPGGGAGVQTWRESRTSKLDSQLRAGRGGGPRVSDSFGPGSADYDERLGVVVSREMRARAACRVVDMLRKPGAMRASSSGQQHQIAGSAVSQQQRQQQQSSQAQRPPPPPPVSVSKAAALHTERDRSGVVICDDDDDDETLPLIHDLPTEGGVKVKQENYHQSKNKPDEKPSPAEPTAASGASTAAAPTATAAAERRIFDGLVIYVNGSTHPLISDHRLKHVLVENGARTAIHLGRRQVTHVILGRPSPSSSSSSGDVIRGVGVVGASGGGLAAGKLEREIRRVAGCGVKFVGVEWVLESIKAGRRLPEARFANLKMSHGAQQSVYGTFFSSSSSTSSPSSSTAPAAAAAAAATQRRPPPPSR